MQNDKKSQVRTGNNSLIVSKYISLESRYGEITSWLCTEQEWVGLGVCRGRDSDPMLYWTDECSSCVSSVIIGILSFFDATLCDTISRATTTDCPNPKTHHQDLLSGVVKEGHTFFHRRRPLANNGNVAAGPHSLKYCIGTLIISNMEGPNTTDTLYGQWFPTIAPQRSRTFEKVICRHHINLYMSLL